MDNNHNYIDELINNQLSDKLSLQINEVPDDILFVNAITIVSKKRKRRRFIILFISIISFVTLVGFTFYQFNQKQSLNTAFQQEKFAILQQDKCNGVYPGAESHHICPPKVLSIANTQNFSTSQYNSSLSQTKKHHSLDRQYKNSNEQIEKSFYINSLHDKANFSNSTNTKDIVDVHSEMIEQLPLLTIKKISEHTVIPIRLPYLISPLVIKNTIAKEFKSKNSLSLVFSVVNNNSWLTMSNMSNSNKKDMIGYDKVHSCIGLNTELDYEFSPKWFAFFSLGYNQYKNKSNYQDKLLFNPNNIRIDQNNKEVYQIKLDMPSPLGDFYANTSFQVQKNMNPNDTILENMNSIQHFNIINFSLGSRKEFLKYQRLRFSGKIGLGLNYIVNTNNNFDLSLYMDNSLKFNQVSQTSSLISEKSYFIYGLAGMSVEYSLRNNLSLNIESLYNHGLSTLRAKVNKGSPTTYFHSINNLVGLRYKF